MLSLALFPPRHCSLLSLHPCSLLLSLLFILDLSDLSLHPCSLPVSLLSKSALSPSIFLLSFHRGSFLLSLLFILDLSHLSLHPCSLPVSLLSSCALSIVALSFYLCFSSLTSLTCLFILVLSLARCSLSVPPLLSHHLCSLHISLLSILDLSSVS
ncbi:unnamed protein product [Acanthosepion pharaonis]|uniref:Uncharacterized protein n=1 Tax=Acanthosepion pharaonis TaxID=158019 RepID=A0A812B0A0_ACAPH|nr:unnamed protein product [Sepia pharaonis]